MQFKDFEERPEGHWVMFYCRASPPANFTVRLFPTMDRARSFYGTKCRDLYNSPAELAIKFGGLEMLNAYRHLREIQSCRTSLCEGSIGPHAEDVSDDVQFNRGLIAGHLWSLAQQVADRVHGINLSNSIDDDLFVIRVDRMIQPKITELIGTFNRQKKIVVDGLVKLGKSKATEIELRQMMRDLVSAGLLKTKQEPWRIFQYYAPELGDHGFLYYPGKRHKVEDHHQNS